MLLNDTGEILEVEFFFFFFFFFWQLLKFLEQNRGLMILILVLSRFYCISGPLLLWFIDDMKKKSTDSAKHKVKMYMYSAVSIVT